MFYPYYAMAKQLCYLTLVGCGAMTFTQILVDRNKKIATSKFGGKKDMRSILGNDGIILSKNYQLSFKKTLEGSIVIAPTGEHKSTSIVIPNLLSNHFPKCSKVVLDPKGELYRITAAYQKSIGCEPVLFTPLEENACYNLLENCEDVIAVKELAQSILINGDLIYRNKRGISGGGGSEWLSMAEPLLNAILIAMYEKGGSVFDSVNLLVNKEGIKMSTLIKQCNIKEAHDNLNIFASSLESPRTSSSILTTLNSTLGIYLDRRIKRVLGKTDFTAKDLRERPITLYISYPTNKTEYLSPLLATFYSQFISNILATKGLPILFFIDEFGTVGNISNISNITATCRNEKVGFICAIQSISQLNQIYGTYNTKNILSNLKTKILLPSISEQDTLDYFSRYLCGTKEVEKDDRTQRKTLMESDEIRRLDDDEVLILAHNKLPIVDKQNRYYEQYKYYRNATEGEN